MINLPVENAGSGKLGRFLAHRTGSWLRR